MKPTGFLLPIPSLLASIEAAGIAALDEWLSLAYGPVWEGEYRAP